MTPSESTASLAHVNTRTSLPPYLTEDTLDALIARALEEDVGPGDVTTLATTGPEVAAEARLRVKENGIIAGLEVAARVFRATDDALEIDWRADDGAAVRRGTTIGILQGPARSLLTTERLALNFMQRMSGIATATRHMVTAAAPYGAKILDTRKTAPGLRLLDKWAVRLGGGTNHRLGLYDQILIKDNHIAAAGGLRAALRAARHYRAEHEADLQIEVETRTLDEVRTVLSEGGADTVLLDNMVKPGEQGAADVTLLQEAVDLIDGRLATEASGNITLEAVPAVARTGVGAISAGSLTHSVRALDLSLEMTLDSSD